MIAIEYQQLMLYVQELFAGHKMNFISVYLGLLVAIYFVGNRINGYLLSSVLGLYTLYSVESFRHYRSLVNQSAHIRLAIEEEFGESIPILLDWQGSSDITILGVPAGIIMNYSIFILGWLSVIVFAFYTKKINSRGATGT